MSGIPVGLGFQVALSFATAAVWFLAVWKAWPTELESWASASEGRGGNRNRRGRGRGRGRNPQGENRPANERTGNDGNRPRRRRGGRGRRGGNPNSPSRPQ